MHSTNAPGGDTHTRASPPSVAPSPGEEVEGLTLAEGGGGQVLSGKQRLWIEPSMVYARLDGSYTGDEARGIIAALDRFVLEQGSLYMLVNIGESFQITPEARRESSDWGRRVTVGGLAIAGASTHLRILFSLMARGIQMLGGRRVPVLFAATEDEGRAWLARQRTGNA